MSSAEKARRARVEAAAIDAWEQRRGGAPLDPEAAVSCPACGREARAKHNYCGGCGTRLREHCFSCLQPLWDNEPGPLPRPHPTADLKPRDCFEPGGR